MLLQIINYIKAVVVRASLGNNKNHEYEWLESEKHCLLGVYLLEGTGLWGWRAGFQQAAGKIWRRTVLAKTCPGIGRILVSEDRQWEGLARRQVRARSTEQRRGGDHMIIHLGGEGGQLWLQGPQPLEGRTCTPREEPLGFTQKSREQVSILDLKWRAWTSKSF